MLHEYIFLLDYVHIRLLVIKYKTKRDGGIKLCDTIPFQKYSTIILM